MLFLEGYLWDEPDAKDAFREAARPRTTPATVSRSRCPTSFCVDRHRDEFVDLIEHEVDVLFANEVEITSLYEVAIVRRRAPAASRTTARSPRSPAARRAR